MEISMTQGEANRKALDLVQNGKTGEAFARLDPFNRIVEVAERPNENPGSWSLLANRRNGLRVVA